VSSLAIRQHGHELVQHFEIQRKLARCRILDPQLRLAEYKCRLGRLAKRGHGGSFGRPGNNRGWDRRRLQVKVDLRRGDREPAMVWVDAPPRLAVAPRKRFAGEARVPAFETDIDGRDHPLAGPPGWNASAQVKPGGAPGRTPG